MHIHKLTNKWPQEGSDVAAIYFLPNTLEVTTKQNSVPARGKARGHPPGFGGGRTCTSTSTSASSLSAPQAHIHKVSYVMHKASRSNSSNKPMKRAARVLDEDVSDRHFVEHYHNVSDPRAGVHNSDGIEGPAAHQDASERSQRKASQMAQDHVLAQALQVRVSAV